MAENNNPFIGIIQNSHGKLLALTEALTDDQFAQQPSPTAPPIGWHLFHMARWADRLQASFAGVSTAFDEWPEHSAEIWIVDKVASQWRLQPDRLGLLETGLGMAVEDAVAVATLGKDPLLDYARRVFLAAEQAVGALHGAQLEAPRRSILPQLQVSPTGQPYFSNDREVAMVNDLLFHISHASRHLGMIEALRGALFAVAGTASV